MHGAYVDRATAYYRALDAHEYDRLAELLAPSFVQVRPDRTFTSRESFLSFMASERPHGDTVHDLERVLADGDGAVAVGSLHDAGEERLLSFVDVMTFSRDRIERIETYTR